MIPLRGEGSREKVDFSHTVWPTSFFSLGSRYEPYVDPQGWDEEVSSEGEILAGLDRDSQRQIPQYPPCDVLCSVTWIVSDSLWPHRPQAVRLLCPWVSPGKNTGVGCHALLHGNFLIQESNPHLLHCRRPLYRWFTMEAPISFLRCLNPARCRVSSESGCPLTWDTHRFFFFSPKIQTELGISYFYLLTLTTQA